MTKSVQNQIRLLLVIEHQLIRSGLRLLLESHDRIKVIGDAGNQAEAISIAAKERPSIALLDDQIGHDSALDLMPELLAASNATRSIILSGAQDPQLQQRAIRLGAGGMVFKDARPEVLFEAIEKVGAGETWFEPGVMPDVLSAMPRLRRTSKADAEATKIATLTQRESEVIALVGEGLKNKQIAERLFISETTVHHHLTSIFSKLGVSDRLELVVYAYRQGLVNLPAH